MKQLLLLLFIFNLPAMGFAQVCVPDTTITQPGMYPQELANAQAGLDYNQVIQFKFIKDTNYLGTSVQIDSIHLKEISGFPPSLTYACSEQNCMYLGGTNGCLSITGKPLSNEVGNYDIVVEAIAYITFNGSVYPYPTTDTLDLKVTSASGIGIRDINTGFAIGQAFPNPVGDKANIEVILPMPEQVDFKVFTLLGNVVYHKKLNLDMGSNNIVFTRGSLSEGIYLYAITYRGKTLSKKMIVGK